MVFRPGWKFKHFSVERNSAELIASYLRVGGLHVFPCCLIILSTGMKWYVLTLSKVYKKLDIIIDSKLSL